MPIAKRSSVLFACALALAATALAARADDVLVLKNAGDAKEQTLAGKIHTIGPDAVQIAVEGGESKTVPADAVAWLQFEKEPLAFAAVRGEIENAQYDAALEKLADVGADELDRKAPPADFRKDFDWLKARATALKALDADDKSALADAAKLLTAFVRAAPDSPYLYEAQALVGEVALRLGRPDAATAAFNALADAKAPSIRARGKVALADLRLAADDPDAAAALFDAALADAAELDADPDAVLAAADVKTLAKLGAAKTLAKRGDLDAAEKAFAEIIAETPDAATLLNAKIYNALGDARADAGLRREAVLAYLHVELLYRRAKTERARALRALVPLWRALGQNERADAAQKKLRD